MHPHRDPKGAAVPLSPGHESTSRGTPSPVYGPLASRRLGRSLGIDLTPPGCRVCNFDCAYCEVRRRPASPGRWPTPTEIYRDLGVALRRCGSLDSITISGNGEPTLHPDFEAVATAVVARARRLRPRVPVRILTNGSGAVRPGVRRGLDLLDERIVTLDAAAERVDRPQAGCPLGSLIAGISLLRDASVQCCFVDGEISNVGESDVGEWIELVAEMRPRRVRIYTIHRKPATRETVWPVSLDQLQAIATRLEHRTGMRAQVVA